MKRPQFLAMATNTFSWLNLLIPQKKSRKKRRIEPSLAVDRETRIDPHVFQSPVKIAEWVQGVGARLIEIAGLPAASVSFTVSKDYLIGGYAAAPKQMIWGTYGLLRDCRSEDELAGVLAHEIGHIVYPDKTADQTSDLQAQHSREYKADQFAIGLMKKAGYDPEAMSRLCWRWARYQLKTGDRLIFNDKRSTHPSLLKRVSAINRHLNWGVTQ